MTYINWEDSNIHFQPQTPQPADHGIPVPFYGNWGGPHWSAGELNGTDTTVIALSPLDAAFKAHDIAYGTAQGIADIAQADYTLVSTIGTLNFVDPEDSIYAGFASLSIIANIIVSGETAFIDPGLLPNLQTFAIDAVADLETGLAAAPQEGRSLHGALHVFEAQYLPDLIL